LNIYSAKLTGKVLVFLTFSKILALVIVIIGGLVRLGQGYTGNFQSSFAGTSSNVLTIASGFYGGLWAFDGWNNLNYVTEEIINPKRFCFFYYDEIQFLIFLIDLKKLASVYLYQVQSKNSFYNIILNRNVFNKVFHCVPQFTC
jgi:amino acid transporter